MTLNLESLLSASSENASVSIVNEEEQIVFIGSSTGGSPTTKVRPLIPAAALAEATASVATSMEAIFSAWPVVRSGI